MFAASIPRSSGALAAVEVVAGDDGVLDVGVHRVQRVQHGAHAALRILGAAVARGALGHHRHAAVLGHLERVGQAGDAAAQDQEIEGARGRRGGRDLAARGGARAQRLRRAGAAARPCPAAPGWGRPCPRAAARQARLPPRPAGDTGGLDGSGGTEGGRSTRQGCHAAADPGAKSLRVTCLPYAGLRLFCSASGTSCSSTTPSCPVCRPARRGGVSARAHTTPQGCGRSRGGGRACIVLACRDTRAWHRAVRLITRRPADCNTLTTPRELLASGLPLLPI